MCGFAVTLYPPPRSSAINTGRHPLQTSTTPKPNVSGRWGPTAASCAGSVPYHIGPCATPGARIPRPNDAASITLTLLLPGACRNIPRRILGIRPALPPTRKGPRDGTAACVTRKLCARLRSSHFYLLPYYHEIFTICSHPVRISFAFFSHHPTSFANFSSAFRFQR